MQHTYFCLFCQQPFTAHNSRAKFCSIKHRVAYFRKKRKDQQLVSENKAASEVEDYPEFKEYLSKANVTETQEKPRKCYRMLHFRGICGFFALLSGLRYVIGRFA